MLINLVYKLSGRIKAQIPFSGRVWMKAKLEPFLKMDEKCYFSQFGEDAFLQTHFLLSQRRRGFYVDVGAYSPINNSNTYWFYKQGWRGINIEATPGSKKAFDLVRPNDINIEAAVSDQPKEMNFYSWGIPSVYNTLSFEKAREYAKILGKEPIQIKIKTKKLEHILDDYLPGDQEISFFSIDVEGHDLEVLRSNNWQKYRPELVIVEEHVGSIEEVLKSNITTFMDDIGYSVYSWIKPSIIYRRKSLD